MTKAECPYVKKNKRSPIGRGRVSSRQKILTAGRIIPEIKKKNSYKEEARVTTTKKHFWSTVPSEIE